MNDERQVTLDLGGGDTLYKTHDELYYPTYLRTWKALVGAYKPPPRMLVSEYANTHFRIGAGSADAGRWTCLPYQVGMLDAFCEPQISWIVVQKSKQMGWTKMLCIVISYYSVIDPAPILAVQPTVEDAKEWSKDEIGDLISDSDDLMEIYGNPNAKVNGQTILSKSGSNGAALQIVGANSGRGFRRITRRIVLGDEISGYPPSITEEGDQIMLAANRAAMWWNRKIGLGSTPTVKGACRVEREFNQVARGHFMLHCPHCGDEHVRRLRPGGYSGDPWRLRGDPLPESVLSWPKGQPSKAAWTCPSCAGLIDHSHHRSMVAGGYWRGEGWTHRTGIGFQFDSSFSGRIGFHIWTSYGVGPESPPSVIARSFLIAKGDSGALRTYVNTNLGETYDDKISTVNDKVLAARGERYPAPVPQQVLTLSCGVDVQPDRFELEVVGWCETGESWSIDYQIIPCETSLPVGTSAGWTHLREAITATYEHQSGRKMPISFCLIDSGYLSNQVVSFVTSLGLQWVRASKGTSGWRPLVENRNDRADRLAARRFRKKSAKPELIGTEEGKLRVSRSLAVPNPGPNYCHFPIDRPEEFFKQITGETLQTYYKNGKTHRLFYQTYERVEALDCRVLALAGLVLSKPDWAVLAKRYAPASVGASMDPRADRQPHYVDSPDGTVAVSQQQSTPWASEGWLDDDL